MGMGRRGGGKGLQLRSSADSWIKRVLHSCAARRNGQFAQIIGEDISPHLDACLAIHRLTAQIQ
jgi:hypothetical protein